MKGYVIKLTNTATEYNKFVQTGEKQEYFIIKGGYVIPTNNYDWLLQEDLYKSKSSVKRALTRYKSDKAPENPSFTTSYDVVEID